jgi:hypothetical protein
MLGFKIFSGWSKLNPLKIDKEGNAHVILRGAPQSGSDNIVRPFRQFFTTDGLPADGINEDMLVDGSATSVDFCIPASLDSDRYIDSISFVIADQNANLNQFGAISALTVGMQIFYEDSQLGDVTIHNGIKSNFDLVRLCGKGASMVGSTTSAFRASNVVGNSEGYIPTLDISDQFNIPNGIRLPKGTNLKLVIRINDNVSAIDGLNAVAYGFDRIIED